MAIDGIKNLIAVTQMKANNANDAALAGADKQSDLISQKNRVRAAQQTLESIVADPAQVSPGVVVTPGLGVDRLGKEIDLASTEVSPFNGLKSSLGDIYKLAEPPSGQGQRIAQLKLKIEDTKASIANLQRLLTDPSTTPENRDVIEKVLSLQEAKLVALEAALAQLEVKATTRLLD